VRPRNGLEEGSVELVKHGRLYPLEVSQLRLEPGGRSTCGPPRRRVLFRARLSPAERASQIELMRATALGAGRDPSTLEYTR
jgi:hypothetical protein